MNRCICGHDSEMHVDSVHHCIGKKGECKCQAFHDVELCDTKPYDPYVEAGYKDRRDYLKSLAEKYSLPFESVRILADALGQFEDFDELIKACECAGGVG